MVRRAAQAESIEIPPEAVAALARSATGSFRDALGTLEQIVTYGGSEIALEDVLAVLGVADARLLAETLDAVAAGDAARALRALEQCAEQGRDAASFASDLEVRARELLVVQTLGELPAELSLTPEADAALLAQAERVDHATVVRVLELLGEAMEAIRAGADARTRLELALVKAARPGARQLDARAAGEDRAPGARWAAHTAAGERPRRATAPPEAVERARRAACAEPAPDVPASRRRSHRRPRPTRPRRPPRPRSRAPARRRPRRPNRHRARRCPGPGARDTRPGVGVRAVAGGDRPRAQRERPARGVHRGDAPGGARRRGPRARVSRDGPVP